MFSCNFYEMFSNFFLTKYLRPTPPTPKSRPTNVFLTHVKILWIHVTHAKIQTHAIHPIFLTHAKFYKPTPPKSPTPKFDPRLPRTHVPMLFSRLYNKILLHDYIICMASSWMRFLVLLISAIISKNGKL